MPYIAKTEREAFDNILNGLPKMETKGQLEYCIFKLMKKYMEFRTFSYSELHDTAYSAQHCADEFRRRFLDVRENFAREINGDILPKIISHEAP